MNSDRFPTTLSMHSVWALLRGLRSEVADLPEIAKLEGHDYANMVGETLETEARHLLTTVRMIAVAINNVEYVADLILELENFPDEVPSFPATEEETERACASLRARLEMPPWDPKDPLNN